MLRQYMSSIKNILPIPHRKPHSLHLVLNDWICYISSLTPNPLQLYIQYVRIYEMTGETPVIHFTSPVDRQSLSDAASKLSIRIETLNYKLYSEPSCLSLLPWMLSEQIFDVAWRGKIANQMTIFHPCSRHLGNLSLHQDSGDEK